MANRRRGRKKRREAPKEKIVVGNRRHVYVILSLTSDLRDSSLAVTKQEEEEEREEGEGGEETETEAARVCALRQKRDAEGVGSISMKMKEGQVPDRDAG